MISMLKVNSRELFWGSGLLFVKSCTPLRRSSQSAVVVAQLSWQIMALLLSPRLPDRPVFRRKPALANLHFAVPTSHCAVLSPSRRLNTTACFRKRIPLRCVSSIRFRIWLIRHTGFFRPFCVVTDCICWIYFIPAPSSGFFRLQRSFTT